MVVAECMKQCESVTYNWDSVTRHSYYVCCQPRSSLNEGWSNSEAIATANPMHVCRWKPQPCRHVSPATAAEHRLPPTENITCGNFETTNSINHIGLVDLVQFPRVFLLQPGGPEILHFNGEGQEGCTASGRPLVARNSNVRDGGTKGSRTNESISTSVRENECTSSGAR